MCLASKHLLLYPVATWLRQVELRVYTIYFLHPYIHRSLLNINISWEKQETNEGWVVIVSEVRIVRSTRSILFYFIVLREGVSTTKNQEPRTKNLVCFLNQSTSHPWGLFLTWFYLPNHLFLLYSWCHIGPDLIKETQSIDRSINQSIINRINHTHTHAHTHHTHTHLGSQTRPDQPGLVDHR